MTDLNDMSLAEIIEAGARNEFIAGAGMLTAPALASDDARRELVRILFAEPRFQHPQATFGRNARKVVVHVIVAKRDRETMDMLERIARDATHPLATEALEELLATRDRAIIAPLYAEFVPAVLDAHPFGGYTHRLALGAAYVMGAEAVVRDLVPRYLTEAAITADPSAYPSGLSRASAVIFELIHQIGAKAVAKDDPALIAAVLALESFKPIQKPWKKLVSALDASAVARARGTGPAVAAPAKKAALRKKTT